MEKKVCLEKNCDRISELPEPLQLQILWYLSTKIAVRTCVLSSSWRTVWTGLTCFKLDAHDPLINASFAKKNKKKFAIRKAKMFYKFIYRVLGSITNLEELELRLPRYNAGLENLELKSHMNHWLDCAVGFNVKKLDLNIGGFTYRLPKSVLSCKSITILRLSKCKLNFGSLTDTKLPSLSELRLEEVYLSDVVLEGVLANCLNLRSFTLISCSGLRRLKVLGLIKLESVVVAGKLLAADLEAIEISEPNLLELSYEYENKLYEIEVSGCKNMRRLELYCIVLFDVGLSILLQALPFLEELKIRGCDYLRHVEISRQQLVSLTFDSCLRLSKVKADTTKLKYFSFVGKTPISFVSKRPSLKPRLACAYLKLALSPKTEKRYSKLIKLLAKLGQSEKLSLDFADVEDFIIPENVRIMSRPPLCEVKQLQVKVGLLPFDGKTIALIESLLWLAPCPESISVSYSREYFFYKVFKFKYERPLKGKKSCGCWKSLPAYCWRHSLSQVLLETQDESDIKHSYLCRIPAILNDVGTELAKFFQKRRIDGMWRFMCKQMVSLNFDDCEKLVMIKVDSTILQDFTFIAEDPVSFVPNCSSLKLKQPYLYLENSDELKVLRIGYWYLKLLKFLAMLGQSENVTLDSAHVEFKYETPLEGKKSCGSWESLPMPFWRHSLSEVLLKIQEGDQANTQLPYSALINKLHECKKEVVDEKLAKFFQHGRADGKMVSFVRVLKPKVEWSG